MIEVLIAIILIIMGILSVISLAIMVIKGNDQSKKTTIATTMAQEVIEALIRVGHDGLYEIDVADCPKYVDNCNGYTDDSSVYSCYDCSNDCGLPCWGRFDTNGVIYTAGTNTVSNVDYRFLITLQDDTPVTDNKTVTVDVSWGSGKPGESHKNVELKTIISQ